MDIAPCLLSVSSLFWFFNLKATSEIYIIYSYFKYSFVRHLVVAIKVVSSVKSLKYRERLKCLSQVLLKNICALSARSFHLRVRVKILRRLFFARAIK